MKVRQILAAGLLAVFAHAAAQAVEAIETFGQWQLFEKRDAMTDEPTYFIAVSFKEMMGERGFGILCIKKKIAAAMYMTPDFLGLGDDERDFTYRVDDQPAGTSKWLYKGGKSALLASVTKTKELVDSLRIAERLRIRAFAFDGAPSDADFDISGAVEAIAKLEQVCQS